MVDGSWWVVLSLVVILWLGKNIDEQIMWCCEDKECFLLAFVELSILKNAPTVRESHRSNGPSTGQARLEKEFELMDCGSMAFGLFCSELGEQTLLKRPQVLFSGNV